MSVIEIRSCHPAPLNKTSPVALCYCEETHCAVREVTVAYKNRSKSPPMLRCPSCGQPMRLVGYVEEELIPEETTSA